ncbi:MAG: GNAT family N-acetyltransferase, partial [Chloroflexota bacterium]|nr:GNAT family N-acetyltransferase [Chloroflexota bacterium]
MSERSNIEIRIVEPEEFITLGVGHYAFGKSPSKPDLEKARERLKYFASSTGLAVFDHGEPQASCAVHAMTENVRGKVFPMGGIGGVGSMPAGRRQGHVRNMMVRGFELMRDKGEPIATLYPFRDSFYERLGYAEFAKNRFVTLKPEHLAPLMRMSLPGTVEQLGIEECFDEWWAFLEQLQTGVHGFALFERARAIEWRDKNDSWVAMVREDGEVTGAMTFVITGYT